MGYERNARPRDRFGYDDRFRSRGAYGPQDRYGDADRYGRGRYDPYAGDRYGRESGRPVGYDYDDRGFFDRAGDEVRSWFGDEEAERRREYDHRYDERYERERGRFDEDRYGQRRPDRYSGDYGALGTFRGDWRDQDHDRSREARRRERDDSRGSYVDWRERQNDIFDRDYDEYRREHQTKFDSDFANWRTRRETQRGGLGRVTEHMEVVGSDGVHVGTVDKVCGDRILLTKTDKDAGGHHHTIPSRWIDKVEDRIVLERTAEQAQAAWRDEENRQALFGDDRNQAETGFVFRRSVYSAY